MMTSSGSFLTLVKSFLLHFLCFCFYLQKLQSNNNTTNNTFNLFLL